MMKLAAFLVAAILLLFAVMQLNDPDPLFWFGLYSASALGPLLLLVNRWSDPVFWLALGYCLAGMTLSLHGAGAYLQHAGEESLMQAMSADKLYIEQAREFLGSAIAAALVAGYLLLHRRRPDLFEKR